MLFRSPGAVLFIFMAENSNIGWTDHTFNPVQGCEKVSPGCKNCYAEALVKRYGGDFSIRRRTSESNWKLPLKWNKKPWICENCGRSDDKHYDHSCTGKPEDACHTSNVKWHRARVFCASMADWLDEEWPIEVLADLLKLIHDTPNLDWQCLSKRPENFHARIRLAMDFVVSTGYSNDYVKSSKRKSGLRSDSVWRTGSGQPRENMAGKETDVRSVDKRGENDSMQSCKSGGGECGGVSPSSRDEGIKEGGSSGAPTSLDSFQWRDSATNNDQSQEREQGGQSPGESGTSHNERATCSRLQGSGREALELQGEQSSKNKIDRRPSIGNAATQKGRGDGQVDRSAIRNETESGWIHNNRQDMETFAAWLRNWLDGTPPQNVWIGTSVENQEYADKRIPELLKIPAKVRFLSCEPLLSEVSIVETECLAPFVKTDGTLAIHWVIAGGESGAKRREMKLEWAESLRDQCKAAGVAFFFKQISAYKSGCLYGVPPELLKQEFPK